MVTDAKPGQASFKRCHCGAGEMADSQHAIERHLGLPVLIHAMGRQRVGIVEPQDAASRVNRVDHPQDMCSASAPQFDMVASFDTSKRRVFVHRMVHAAFPAKGELSAGGQHVSVGYIAKIGFSD
ncbi:hypothetical protein KR767_06465 [Luteibacter anthropi]|uniref:hypothetical protein n=1 Tax=Luteibacter anthropi TaxID=564369 RepID=UPI002032CEC7|nr:hypothetical protein [Luteibacter anthropi]URX63694.1 hypothetical protein KR767_06465 [Luteibacter anthropi]